MGGRLDATNIVDPCISVITDVALDHQQFLGNTIGEIATEKAGIIRTKGTVVMLPQHPEANDVLGNIAHGAKRARRQRRRICPRCFADWESAIPRRRPA